MSQLQRCISGALDISYLVGGEGVICVEGGGSNGRGVRWAPCPSWELIFMPPSTRLQQGQTQTCRRPASPRSCPCKPCCQHPD